MGAELVRLTESSSPVTTALAFPPKAEPLARTPARTPVCLHARLPPDVLLVTPEETLVRRMTHYYPLILVSAC